MKVLIINPNSSEKVTEKIRKEAQRSAGDDIEAHVITSVNGPVVIESSYDEVVAAFHTVNELKKREKDFDAAIIACASDPGLSAAKEQLTIPVIGIFEAAVHVCNILGNYFSVIGSCGQEDIAAFRETVRHYGYESRLSSVKYLGVGVSGINNACEESLKECISKAKYSEGVNGIILGCAAFSGMGHKLTEEYGIYVTDGIADALYMAEMMVKIKKNK